MKFRRLLTLLLFASLCTGAAAQFYSDGGDPGKLKWYSIKSDDFKIIYPEGLDSLALEYGRSLEGYRVPVGRSIGYQPNGLYKRPLPVILHAYASANGMVAWAPRRMELLTGPDAEEPESMDWITNLSVHESRHASQMQFAHHRRYCVLNWLLGEIFTGVMPTIYPGQALMEGDAVVTETALTDKGRGRSADFLEYYRVSFADNDFRDFHQWQWGSQNRYTPDYYKAGYMLVGGVRTFFDDPLFASHYNAKFLRGIPHLPFNVLGKTLRKDTGLRLKTVWPVIAEKQQEIWANDEAARGPFLPARKLTEDSRRFAQYSAVNATPDGYIALRSGLTSTTRLVSIDTLGRVDVIRPFTPTSSLEYSAALDRIFWSESIPDIRWSQKSTSRIRSANTDGSGIRTLTKEGRLYNPAPSSDTRLSATEYPIEGGSAVVILDGNDGTVLSRFEAPDSLQVVETAWTGDTVLASAISTSGFGIYCVTDGYRQVLAPTPAKIKQLDTRDGSVLFVSDRLGVNELYSLDPSDGTVTQMTSNRFGASDFIIANDSVTFAALTRTGRMLYRSELQPIGDVNYSEAYKHPVAETLSAQEASLAAGKPSTPGEFSEPVRYRKAAHLLLVHSWAPIYAGYDNISNTSFETVFTVASLGATVYFQNDLGTAHGYAGYSARPGMSEADKRQRWFHAGHAMFTYSGLFPVFELTADYGERNTYLYTTNILTRGDHKELFFSRMAYDKPSFGGSMKVYVPLNFSSGGWSRGLIPQAKFTFSNDTFNTGEILFSPVQVYTPDRTTEERRFTGYCPGTTAPFTNLATSLRGYTMLGTAGSGIYPRWGLGAEIGYAFRPGLNELFKDNLYAVVYGYIPGIIDTHGIKLLARTQIQGSGKVANSYTYIIPKGFSNESSAIQNFIEEKYPVQNLLCVEYALPLLSVNWSGLGRFAYLRNFELRGFNELGLYGGGTAGKGTLASAGASFAARLSNFLWLPYDVRAGIEFCHNYGSIFNSLLPEIEYLNRNSVSFIFTVDL